MWFKFITTDNNNNNNRNDNGLLGAESASVRRSRSDNKKKNNNSNKSKKNFIEVLNFQNSMMTIEARNTMIKNMKTSEVYGMI